MSASPEFELPDVDWGPDRFSLRAAAADRDAIVLLFQRDHYGGNCSEKVTDMPARYDAFEGRNAAGVSILPEPADRSRRWQNDNECSFTLVADGHTGVGDLSEQPTRFGPLGDLRDLIGWTHTTVVLDARNDVPAVVDVYRGSSPFDRPPIDDLLVVLDDLDGDAEGSSGVDRTDRPSHDDAGRTDDAGTADDGGSDDYGDNGTDRS